MARLGALVPELERAGAQVLGVSCDSRLTLAAWKKAMGYPVRLVSDFWPHGEIGRAYGVFDPKLGIHTRGTFVIDPDGAVTEVISSPDLGRARDIEGYLDAVRRATR